jgi:hypothetical protein
LVDGADHITGLQVDWVVRHRSSLELWGPLSRGIRVIDQALMPHANTMLTKGAY